MLLPYTELLLIVCAAFIVCVILPGRVRCFVLLAVSLGIYVAGGTKLWPVLPLAGASVWLLGLWIGRTREKSPAAAKALMFCGVGASVLCLLLPRFTGLWQDGRAYVAPVGMSFFLLEAIAYLVDVCGGGIAAERNPLYCLLYVAFFPTVASGPIERPGHLIPQLKRIQELTRRELLQTDRICDGALLILFGMFCKLVIADRAAIVADLVFGEYWHYGTTGLALGVICYSLQLYCDFMGYSVMVTGMAALFGVELADNFRAPYLSVSMGDVWRRWHISFSSWLRDYVYIPLGGSRHGRVRRAVNLCITFLVSGLWHGTGPTYLLWGLVCGVYNIADGALARAGLTPKEGRKLPFGKHLLCAALTFVFWGISVVIFRAPTVAAGAEYLYRMIRQPDFWILSDMDALFSFGLDLQEALILLFALPVLFGADFVTARRGLRIDRYLERQGAAFRVCFALFLLFYTLIFGRYGAGIPAEAFIYQSF